VKSALPLFLLLAGCSSHTAWQLSAGKPHVNSQVQVHGGSGVATAFGLTILAAGAYEMARSGVLFAGDSRHPPEMAPDRKVSEQDCSKPLDYSLGNIRCK
jgi:hypothetical protein